MDFPFWVSPRIRARSQLARRGTIYITEFDSEHESRAGVLGPQWSESPKFAILIVTIVRSNEIAETLWAAVGQRECTISVCGSF